MVDMVKIKGAENLKRFNESQVRGDSFRLDLSDFEKLSREVGYWNAISNIKDEDDNYDREAIVKYEDLREEQLIMFQKLIDSYSAYFPFQGYY